MVITCTWDGSERVLPNKKQSTCATALSRQDIYMGRWYLALLQTSNWSKLQGAERYRGLACSTDGSTPQEIVDRNISWTTVSTPSDEGWFLPLDLHRDWTISQKSCSRKTCRQLKWIQSKKETRDCLKAEPLVSFRSEPKIQICIERVSRVQFETKKSDLYSRGPPSLN